MKYRSVIRSILYPAFQKLKGRSTMSLLRRWERLHLEPEEEIDQFQFQCLRDIIQHAYDQVPFYRRTFNLNGFDPGDLRALEDIQKIPMLSKADVKENLPQFVASEAQGPLRTVRTGGSTGEPMKYFMGQDALAANQAVLWRSRRWHGLDIGQPNLLIWGHSETLQGGIKGHIARFTRPLKDRILNRWTFSAYDLSERKLEKITASLRKHHAVFLRGYATSLYALAKYVDGRENPVDLEDLRGIITTSEVLYPWQRKQIEDAFRCPVIDEYGANETGIMAYSCPEGNLHLMDENLYVEVIKDEGAGPDELGEIVVTQLHHRSAPLIRYRIGDVALGIDRGCPCGSNLRILKGLKGRIYDLFVTKQNDYIHAQYFTHLLRQSEGVKKFQVIQVSREKIRIKLVLDMDPAEYSTQKITRLIRDMMGEDIEIEYMYVDHIPVEESGKYRWIVSEVQHNLLESER